MANISIKEEVIKALEQNRGRYVSGGELAREISVSRNAVWKAVNALRAEGCEINSVTNRGYALSEGADTLSEEGIAKYLDNDFFKLTVKKNTQSTNADAKALAALGASEGTVVVAEEQSGGRGRLNRAFYSPAKSGVYVSVLLRPDKTYADAEYLTVFAGLAVAEAITAVCGADAQIKWVNDVLVGGKKCAGILTEVGGDMESGRLEYAVIGMGVNLYEPAGGFPADIKNTAGAACANCVEIPDVRNRITAEILKNLQKYYLAYDVKAAVKSYREKSAVIGKTVRVKQSGDEFSAEVVNIDDQCRLVISKNGKQETLTYGDVRITV